MQESIAWLMYILVGTITVLVFAAVDLALDDPLDPERARAKQEQASMIPP